MEKTTKAMCACIYPSIYLYIYIQIFIRAHVLGLGMERFGDSGISVRGLGIQWLGRRPRSSGVWRGVRDPG